MATKKPETKPFAVTGKIDNLQVNLNVNATSLEEAVAQARKLKFSDFVTTKGDIFDYEGPEITSVWKN